MSGWWVSATDSVAHMHIESTEAKSPVGKQVWSAKVQKYTRKVETFLRHRNLDQPHQRLISFFCTLVKCFRSPAKYICLTLSPNTVSKLNKNISIV